MSQKDLQKFLEAIRQDSSLQEKLQAATDADTVVTIAKAAGFVISSDELKRAQAEISEEELEGLAGGVNVPKWDAFGCFFTNATPNLNK
jgi:predicted ribosomally synthesized peptide with nif11-like leader